VEAPEGRACDLGGSGAGEAEEAAGLEREESGVSGAYEEEDGRTIRACEHPNA
jgi:hypothetical protein